VIRTTGPLPHPRMAPSRHRFGSSSNGKPATRQRSIRLMAKARFGGVSKALGTSSSDFVEASLFQLQAAARLPGGGISELGVNSALALIEGAAPKDEIEGALAVQMACTHIAAMALFARLQDGYQTERRTSLFATAASRLLRVYVSQVETLRRLRHGGSQFVRVEHVHVNEGGQAVIGNVRSPTSSS
jgi:hypothetical protein